MYDAETARKMVSERVQQDNANYIKYIVKRMESYRTTAIRAPAGGEYENYIPIPNEVREKMLLERGFTVEHKTRRIFFFFKFKYAVIRA